MDNSPTALFDSYEQDFQQIVDSLKEKLEGDVKDERAGEISTLVLCLCFVLLC
jgi:vesicle transport through interaction with t-SNAREs protein 1